MENVVDLKMRRGLKQLRVVDKDLNKLIFNLNKMIPALRPYSKYIGMKVVVAKMEETQLVLELYSRRVRSALNGKND